MSGFIKTNNYGSTAPLHHTMAHPRLSWLVTAKETTSCICFSPHVPSLVSSTSRLMSVAVLLMKTQHTGAKREGYGGELLNKNKPPQQRSPYTYCLASSTCSGRAAAYIARAPNLRSSVLLASHPKLTWR